MKFLTLALLLLQGLAHAASITRPSGTTTTSGGGSTPFQGGFVPNFTEFGSSVQVDGVLAGSSATFKNTVVSQSSSTASAFFGDGSHLTGIGGGFIGACESTGTANILCTGTPLSGNALDSTDQYSVLGGGNGNSIGFLVFSSVLAGGQGNSISQNYSVISGGLSQISNGQYSTVAGGQSNHSTATGATVSGGQGNNATATDSVISGGDGSLANGQYSSVGGGFGNTAGGDYSVAGGRGADSAGTGSWAMADGSGNGIVVTTNNAAGFYYSGGFYFNDSVGTMSFVGGILSAPFFSGDGSLLTNLPSSPFLGGYVPNVTTFGSSVTATEFGDGFGTDIVNGTITSNTIFGATLVTGTSVSDQGGASMNSGIVNAPVLMDNFNDNMQGGTITDSAGDNMGAGNIQDNAGDTMGSGIIAIANGAFLQGIAVHDFGGDVMDGLGNISAVSSMTAGAFFGDGSHLTGISTGSVSSAGGFSLTLGAGTTFFAFAPSRAITLKRITATVVVAGIAGAGDTYACQDSLGHSLSVTVSAAATAGTVTTATGNVAIGSGVRVNGLLSSSSAATTPEVNVICDYSSP